MSDKQLIDLIFREFSLYKSSLSRHGHEILLENQDNVWNFDDIVRLVLDAQYSFHIESKFVFFVSVHVESSNLLSCNYTQYSTNFDFEDLTFYIVEKNLLLPMQLRNIELKF